MDKRSGFRRLSARDQDGFTLVELVVALTIIGGVLVSIAYLLTGALGAYAASRQRSNMIEVANGVMETLRASDYDEVGLDTADPLTAIHQYTDFDGRDAVVVSPASALPYEEVNPSDVPGVKWYRIHRWVTWTDADNGTGDDFKKLDVRITWPESGSGSLRTFSLTSLLYPGGRGTPLGPTSNQDPTALFSYSPASPPVGTNVHFTNASTDPNAGDTLSYVWTIGAFTTTDEDTDYTFPSAGAYTVTLQVMDGEGGIDTVSQTINVTGPNSPPVAAFTVLASPGRPDVVMVDAGTSTDAEGPLSYEWDWGDGSAPTTGQVATHRYLVANAAGYEIKLKVTDSGGATDEAETTHSVGTVGCSVIRAAFHNPSTNTTVNSIEAGTSGKPDDTQFRFTAETTTACNSIEARLPYNGGTLVQALAPISVGSTKVWEITTSVANSLRFIPGEDQTGYVWTPSTTGNDHQFPFAFDVI